MTFKTKSAGKITPEVLYLNTKSITPEIYNGEKTSDLDLQFRSKGSSSNGETTKYVLYQNIPNPFSGTTNIQFNAPKSDAAVELSIYDLSGKIVYKNL